jgi:hypothetical protein
MYCDYDAIGYLMLCVYTLDDTTLYPQEWKVSYQLDQQTNHTSQCVVVEELRTFEGLVPWGTLLATHLG